MKKTLARKMQKLLKEVSLNSIGRSAPPGIYEKKISKELKESILKMKDSNSRIE